MSDVNGKGYGYLHNWEYVGTSPHYSCTEYRCRKCGAKFYHYYNEIEDIFEAIQDQKIAEACI